MPLTCTAVSYTCTCIPQMYSCIATVCSAPPPNSWGVNLQLCTVCRPVRLHLPGEHGCTHRTSPAEQIIRTRPYIRSSTYTHAHVHVHVQRTHKNTIIYHYSTLPLVCTQPKIICRYRYYPVQHRMGDEEGLEHVSPYGLVPTLGLHVDSSCKADTAEERYMSKFGIVNCAVLRE